LSALADAAESSFADNKHSTHDAVVNFYFALTTPDQSGSAMNTTASSSSGSDNDNENDQQDNDQDEQQDDE
jgi:hypothetical protein